MKALFRYFDGYRRQLVLGPLFKLTEAVLELFVPLLMANIIDVGIKNGDVKYVVTHGLFMLGLGAVGLACALTCQYFAAVCAQGFGRSLRKDLFRHVFSLSQAEYGSVGTNSLITRLTSDVNQVQTGVNMFIRLAIRAPFLTVGSIVMAFTINWKIALVFLLSTPLIVFVLYRVMSRSLPEYTRIQRQQDVISRLAGENLEGARVIRAFSKQDSEIEQFQQAGDTLSDITIRVGKLSAALNPITSVIANLAIVAIVWFGGLFAQDGGIEQGQIIAMVNYMTQTLLALIVLANIIVILTKALASAKRVSEVLAQESSMPEPEPRAFCSARSLPVSSSRRLRFWSRNESCCFRPAASSWIWERALEAFSRWFLAASRSIPSDVIASFLAVFSASSSSMDARSPAIFLRISRICSSSWRFSRFMSAEDSVSSSFFWFSCRRDSFAVFCSRYRAWREVRTLERLLFFSSRRASWKTSSFWIRSTARRAFLQASSISSISLLRPRRLLEFLKAPPLMEPPGLKRSPSGVTMRME